MKIIGCLFNIRKKKKTPVNQDYIKKRKLHIIFFIKCLSIFPFIHNYNKNIIEELFNEIYEFLTNEIKKTKSEKNDFKKSSNNNSNISNDNNINNYIDKLKEFEKYYRNQQINFQKEIINYNKLDKDKRTNYIIHVENTHGSFISKFLGMNDSK